MDEPVAEIVPNPQPNFLASSSFGWSARIQACFGSLGARRYTLETLPTSLRLAPEGC
jgi:hypothetical protein